MKLPVHPLLFLLAVFLSSQSLAQLTITSPTPRMVFQRSLGNDAAVLVTGNAPLTATNVDARFVPIAVGQGTVTAWTALTLIPGTSAFRGKVTVSAGWYRLDVRAKAGTSVIAQTQVGRVGVGEVFVVAGQSNVYGGFDRVPGALDDRVSCLDFRQDSLSEQVLPLLFGHVSYGSSIGPSQPPHLWGVLGDSLVKRLNVPVLFLGAALGGSSSSEWQQGAAGNLGTTTNSAVYRRLGVALLHYVTRTGVRAVLWHQGESDVTTSYQTYYNNLNTVIGKSRQQLAYALPWMVSRVSYNGFQTNPSVIQAQNQLIADLPGLFPGPATDTIIGSANRPDAIHMRGPGMYRFINTWLQCLTTSFWQNAVPYQPTTESTLITSGYTAPLTRRPGESVVAASLRSDPHETDNQYIAQLIRVSDGVLMYESAPTTDNPILFNLPTSLADGQYRLRTRSTHPVLLGTFGEPFTVQQSASPKGLSTVQRPPVIGGTADGVLRRFGYRYEPGTHGFYAMAQATAPVEVRIQRIDGGSFTDSGWNLMPPSSQAPDYVEFADFNYLRNYPPTSGGVGGVEPAGLYRYSIRRQGDSGQGLWFDLKFIGRRITVYLSEPIPAVAPVLTISDSQTACLSGTVNVAIDVSEGTLNSGNVFSIRLSDATGSFANETVVGTGSTSPVAVTLPSSLSTGGAYRLRVVASNPAVASAPSQPFAICQTGADLSMSMLISNRTPAIGTPVTFTLVLANAGTIAADGVIAKSLLPDGMEYVDSPSPAVSAVANTVSINAGTLAVGSNLPFEFRLKPNQEGFFVTSAQITASSQTDPDSQPNSGTGDGQDDAASIDFRTTNASGFISVSPNPNQVPLPPVQSNQPPADPAKADLSLALQASTLVPTASTSLSVSLIVTNKGGLNASNVVVQLLLPTGWQLTNAAGLSVNGQTVSGTLSSVAAGTSEILVMGLQASSTATLMAQVFSGSPADPDSTAGNGFTNGEDDEASLLIRIP
ncbi:sialate O-acetylesterase [Spirosoma sp. KNUC1025]|uniref:sialate O-acetylesterase n=1 Tax=Spirosoma sp. KNUC1025 TaxID=2894082 RepID=UPI003867490E|nr:DUF11 domain-containing protein [Spirosoma sp. KNUC1025]